MQEQLQNEKLKKILIALVVLALFGTSYYYYGNNANKTAEKTGQKTLAKKGQKSGEKVELNKKSTENKEKSDTNKLKETKKVLAQKKDKYHRINKKIKPTNKADLISAAFKSAGKSDPFSYSESRYMPINFEKIGGHGLPTPPRAGGFGENPNNLVVIKGFLGKKVIIEVNGFTDSLKINETLGKVKVLGINSENLSCNLEIEGKKVTKTMQPIIEPDENIKIIFN